MDKRVIVILGSHRKDSNTKRFVLNVCNELDYDLVDLLDYHINQYNYDNNYSDRDEFNNIIGKILQCDTLIFATPVYWYAMSGLMKVFFDRLNDLITINKPTGRKLKGKTVKLLATGTDAELPAGFEVPFKYTAEYFDMVFDGCVYQMVNS